MSEASNDIPISEALGRIRARARLLAVLMLVGLVIGVILAVGLRPVYVGEVLLSAQKDSGGGGIESMARRFSSIASVAGINLGEGGAEADVAKATLSSVQTLAEFIAAEGLKRELLENAGTRFAGIRFGGVSDSDWLAVQVLKSHLKVTPEKGSALVRLRVEWYDPELAARWANGIVAFADARLRREALNTAEARLDYLKKRVSEGGAVVVQEAASRVMEDSLRTMAIAGADPQFAIKVVDKAVSSERPMRPRKKLIVATFGALALLLGVLLAVLRPVRQLPHAS